MSKHVYKEKMMGLQQNRKLFAYEVEFRYGLGSKPKTERCYMITDFEPTVKSIRESHLVKFAYFPDPHSILMHDFISNGDVKEPDVKSVKTIRTLTPLEAFEIFTNGKKWLNAKVKHKKDSLSREKAKQANLSEILSKIKKQRMI